MNNLPKCTYIPVQASRAATDFEPINESGELENGVVRLVITTRAKLVLLETQQEDPIGGKLTAPPNYTLSTAILHASFLADESEQKTAPYYFTNLFEPAISKHYIMHH